MNNKHSFILILLGLLLFSPTINAADIHYLPLKTDALFELELEKLAVVAKMPALAKPYHIATVNRYLEVISGSHPVLHSRIVDYLSRYVDSSNLTQLSIEGSYSNFELKSLANSRGRTTDSNFQGYIAGYMNLSEHVNLFLGGTLYDGSDGFIPNNTYLSFTHEYFQIDLGYKEIWLSPLQESAMLLSTQAKPIARFSISSPTPISDWEVRYDISFGKLEEMEGIRLGEDRFTGRPGFLTMHFSSQPIDWWTIGISRTFVFGGGPRKIDIGDVWAAIIDPVSSDNCGGDSELQNCEEEAGNQQASISSKFDLDWGMPVSLYFELAGEDTNDFKPYKLGNKAYNIGVFLPYLTDDSSALIEYQHIENGWYTHHIYQEGYRNNLNSMGHWWGDEKLLSDAIGARILTLRYNNEYKKDRHFEAKLSTIENLNLSDEGNYDESIYQRATELTLAINMIEDGNIWRYGLYTGKNLFDQSFARISIEYKWR